MRSLLDTTTQPSEVLSGIFEYQNIEEDVNSNYVVFRALDTMFKQPVQWFRKTVVEPSRGESYSWYHREFRRVPTIDECYMDDIPCRFNISLF